MLDAIGLRDACDLDLLLFFTRHPSVVLSSEQLAAYVGYDLPQVARSLDLLVGAGLVRRSLNQGTPGRMYVLESPQEWLEPLRQTIARNTTLGFVRRLRVLPTSLGRDAGLYGAAALVLPTAATRG